ncbi:Ribonuclease H-like protein [Theobroma cacao]|uniref:Ribonuclease H-like protein n=1 Tax=Theobroma cacao TaxID=3641 RepID=A0A061FY63_THECC|nr:Ribonuclease H-like protein [Theobroma cacao]
MRVAKKEGKSPDKLGSVRPQIISLKKKARAKGAIISTPTTMLNNGTLPSYPIKGTFPILNDEDYLRLMHPVESKEVYDALFEIKPLKAPRWAIRNGMSVNFWKDKWLGDKMLANITYRVANLALDKVLQIMPPTLAISQDVPYWGVSVSSKFTIASAYDYLRQLSSPTDVNSSGMWQEEVLIGWRAPQVGWVCINMDGAYKKSIDEAFAGGVIRNSEGDWRTGFVAKLGKCLAYRAELWGVLHDLRLAWDSRFKKVMVQVDNKMVVQAILMDKLLPCANTDLIRAIKDILQKEWEVHFVHIYREDNNSCSGILNTTMLWFQQSSEA